MAADSVVAVAVVPVESAIAGKRLTLADRNAKGALRPRPSASAPRWYYAARAGISPENWMMRCARWGFERLTFKLGTPISF